MGKLLIVESGKKGKSISKFLGAGWTVAPCYGHVCDLPRKEYGVDKSTFEEVYTHADDRQASTIRSLQKAAKNAEHVYIGTDPDREGEAIAWHLVRLLRLKPGQYSRVEWNEITRAGVERALANAREVDRSRVDAQRSRRVLDRIVGYDVSESICWPAGAKAAGRVQTPTLHILCEREREIAAFVAEDYYTLSVTYAEGLAAILPEETSETVVDDEGAEHTRTRIRAHRFARREDAAAVQAIAEANPHIVERTEQKDVVRRPLPAYDTPGLQKDASAKLSLSPKETMDLAQALYEGGFITYMRTDSTRLSEEAVEMARAYISTHQPGALAPHGNRGRAGDQDAHEAIRPTSLETALSALPGGSKPLYEMIVARFLSTQCKPAVFSRTSVHIRSGDVQWLGQGSVLVDPGFLVFWAPYARSEDVEIPALAAGQELSPSEYDLEKKRTTPPGRYSEAELIERMKISGIGRPATYASTLETLKGHGYIEVDRTARGKAIVLATPHGMMLDSLMCATVPALVTEKYTAEMEASLDRIEKTNFSRIEYLRSWYADFARTLAGAAEPTRQYCRENGLRPRGGPGGGEPTDIDCDRCEAAKYVKRTRRDKKSKFLACSDESCGFMRDVRVKTKKAGCGAAGCGGTLVERKRRDKSSFMACAKAGCSYTENADGTRSSGLFKREASAKRCPRCEKHDLDLFRLQQDVPNRSSFYRCPDTKECRFTLDFGAAKSRINCDCGGIMLERTSKKGSRFWGCAKCPKVRFMTDPPPKAT